MIRKAIPGYEGIYEINEIGEVFSMPRGGRGRVCERRLKGVVDRQGYILATLCRAGKSRLRRVHHLVLETFGGPRPPGLQTRHLDGNPANNSLSNLKWGTYQENSDDRKKHGTISGWGKEKPAPKPKNPNHITAGTLLIANRCRAGANNGRARLTEADVIRLRSVPYWAPGEQAAEAKRLGVKWSALHQAIIGTNWKHLPNARPTAEKLRRLAAELSTNGTLN